jgi:hypothetical protein
LRHNGFGDAALYIVVFCLLFFNDRLCWRSAPNLLYVLRGEGRL